MWIIRPALALVILAEGVWCLAHIGLLPPTFPVAIGLSLLAVWVPERALKPAPGIVASIFAWLLGLAVVWGAYGVADEHPRRVMSDLGWAQAALGGWLAYTRITARSRSLGALAQLDDKARARWREGDVAFARELTERIFVSAQPSWAALVLETAWPEPRPEVITELLEKGATASHAEVVGLLERLAESTPRFELARAVCDVIQEARSRSKGDTGGLAAGRFVVVAAQAMRDDEHAERVFAALVLPAVAHRG